ncbi:TetR family transcriptional regulator [Geodermatophilus normandii]|uniref:TetR family transcriptional regulator n=1 Tax=Geodermatophilus normandii TaxID=1137989 RepID=A0A317QG50_9ACTN|nr:TetR/AcrR family transcriptional regulator [Geodermatophilus normandii]PWW21931.1 TetR family transcriptional regulator [Geodermatophilus normandii]
MARDLRSDLLTAAGTLLERTGSAGAVSLRGVAREAGVSAPAVYGHFADLGALLDAVLERAFTDLVEAVTAAAEGVPDPVDRLLAGCRAYVRCGLSAPGRYRAMFGRRRVPAGEVAFGSLVGAVDACVRAGRSASRDPRADATLVWTALHGLVMLRAGGVDRPGPDLDAQVDALVRRLALVGDGSA